MGIAAKTRKRKGAVQQLRQSRERGINRRWENGFERSVDTGEVWWGIGGSTPNVRCAAFALPQPAGERRKDLTRTCSCSLAARGAKVIEKK